MAGKSTIVRGICAVSLLANCGLMVPAREAHVPAYDSIMLRTLSVDSGVEGISRYILHTTLFFVVLCN